MTKFFIRVRRIHGNIRAFEGVVVEADTSEQAKHLAEYLVSKKYPNSSIEAIEIEEVTILDIPEKNPSER